MVFSLGRKGTRVRQGCDEMRWKAKFMGMRRRKVLGSGGGDGINIYEAKLLKDK
jgi:hypothetical protein